MTRHHEQAEVGRTGGRSSLLGAALAAALGLAAILVTDLFFSDRLALLGDVPVLLNLAGLIGVWVLVGVPLILVTESGRRRAGALGGVVAILPFYLPIYWLARATFLGGQARRFALGGLGPVLLSLILAGLLVLLFRRSDDLRRRVGRFATCLFWVGCVVALQFANRLVPFGLYPVHHAACALFSFAFATLAVSEVLPARAAQQRVGAGLAVYGICLVAALAHLQGLHHGPMAVRALLLSSEGLVSTRDLGRFLPYRRESQDEGQSNAFSANHLLEVERRERGRSLLDTLRPADKLDVIILSIDAVRADHTSLRGFSRDTTPFLAEFASECFDFKDARSASTASFFSLSAMLSGAYPSAISLLRGRDPEFLSAAMQRQGWSTVGYYTDAVFTARPPEWTPPDQRMGFETFRLATEESHEMIPLLLDVIDRQTGPYLLFTHFMDPHFDYTKRPGFDFGDEAIDRYHSELAWVDQQVKRFVGELKARGRLERTILVITSDHGEAFGEHGALLHGGIPYEEQCRVPLLIRVPFLEGGRTLDGAVSLTSLSPTLVDLLGLPPLRDVEAPSLAVMMLEPVDPESLFAVVERPTLFDRATWPSTTALVRGRWKLMHDRDAGVARLFDLVADPLETKDAGGAHPEILEDMLALESEWRADRRLWRARGSELPADFLAWADRLRQDDQEAFEHLQGYLDDDNQIVRRAAALNIYDAILGGRAKPEVLLAAGRRKADPVVTGLGDLLVSSAAHRPLMEGEALLDAADPRLRRRAAAALWRMREESFLRERVMARLEIEDDAETRADLLGVALAQAPQTVDMPKVIDLIATLSGKVVSRLVFSVMSQSDDFLRPWFQSLLRAPDVRVTMSVLESLGARDTEFRRTTLRRFLRNRNVTLRRLAIHGLNNFPASTWKRDLLIDLIRHEPHDEMRILAGVQAMALPDPEFSAAFLDALAVYPVTGMGFGHILATTRPVALATWDQRQHDDEGPLANGANVLVPIDIDQPGGLAARRLLVTLIRDAEMPASDDVVRVHDAEGRELFVEKHLAQSAMYFVDMGFSGADAVTPPLTVSFESAAREDGELFGKFYVSLIPLRTPYHLWSGEFDRPEEVAVLSRFGPGWDCSLEDLDRVFLLGAEGELRLLGEKREVGSAVIEVVGAAADCELELSLNGKSLGRYRVPARAELRLEIGDLERIYDRWHLNRVGFAVRSLGTSTFPSAELTDCLALKKVIWR